MSAIRKPTPSWRVVQNPKVCGGEPIIEGTRIPVSSIVNLWLSYRDVDRLLSAFPRLDRDAVLCALDYFQQHQAEISYFIAEAEPEACAT